MPTSYASVEDYRAAGATILSEDPVVVYFDDFISESEAAAIRARAEGKTIRASVIDAGGEDGKGDAGPDRRKSNVRTNRVHWIKNDSDPVVVQVAERIADLVCMPLPHAESMQVIHYSTNTEYKAHFDAFDPYTPAGAKHWRRGGQRLVTALCYINTPRMGGQTAFPKLGFEVPAVARRLVVFHNCKPGTLERHPLSVHAGTPVVAGHKWAFNLWFRDQYFETKVEPPTAQEQKLKVTPAPRTLLKRGLAKTRQGSAGGKVKKHPLLSK